jgi:hypothetical protein
MVGWQPSSDDLVKCAGGVRSTREPSAGNGDLVARHRRTLPRGRQRRRRGRPCDRVAALPEEDIFHGVVFTHHLLGHNIMAPASDIDRITERAVYLKSTSQAAEEYERFHEMHVKRLGLTGLFRWKHLGWKDFSE